MKYFVSIGQAWKNWKDELEASENFTQVPFPVESLQDAHLIVSLSKSPVWTILEGETESSWDAKEIEVSPLVKQTRERRRIERLALVEKINAQPKKVTKSKEKTKMMKEIM